MKYISILGSTGSIGTQTLEIVREDDELCVSAMSCGRNLDLFEKQIREFCPRVVSVSDEAGAEDLRMRLSDMDGAPEVRSGMDGLCAVATDELAEIVVTAVVGMIGIRPTIAAINAGKDIALANKETLVTAGHIIMPLAKEKGVSILPVDSEHSAIFQSLQGNEMNRVHRIILTASGGPFRGKSYEELNNVTVEDALAHPNWAMGKKITIDSATMANKGLEVIEARWLFDVPKERISVHIHPQSILHSAVEFADGAVVGQMGLPDMKLPIRYALYYPKRVSIAATEKRLDLFEIGTLTFERPDRETFFALSLAYDALEAGGNVPTVFNAANEAAVDLFLSRKISFLRISELISEAMVTVGFVGEPSVEDILETERETREFVARAARLDG